MMEPRFSECLTNNIYSFKKKNSCQLHVVESLETIIVYYELTNVLQAC
jgi:hypothetical protein